MEKIKRFAKNYKYSIPLALVIILVIFIATRGGDAQVKSETVTVVKTNVVQEVSVTGRVVPAQEVELAVQSGGKITSISTKVGQKVVAGQTLLRVDTSDLQIRLGRQQASLEKARLALGKQAPGTSAQDALNKSYEDGFNTVTESFVDIPTMVSELHNMFYGAYYSPYLDDQNLRSISETARSNKYSIGVRFDRAEDRYDALLKIYNTFSRNASPQQLDTMLSETYALLKELSDIVKDTQTLVKFVEDRTSAPRPSEIDRDQTTLDSYSADINSHLTAITSIRTEIKDSQKGITDQSSDIQSSRIDIRQAELDVQDTLVQISQRTIKSPTAGTVTDITAEIGETISPGSPVISVISSNQYEIEANLPEADIAKVVVGAEVDVTLDAYGSDVIFKARVTSVNPSETLVDGVATYKTQFQFIDNDDRIKSGMTASLIIKGERKENVIAIPQRSVITRGLEKFVQVLEGEKIVEKTVQTGLRGTDGNIEITSGISEGEKVVVFSEQK